MNDNIFAITVLIFVIIIYIVLNIVGYWKIFVKSGVDGWKACVPIYNIYTMVTKVARKSAIIYFWFPFISTIGYIFVISNNFSRFSFSYNALEVILTVILCSLIYIILIFVLTIKLALAISRNFGHGTGIAVGLIFAPYLFYLYLGYSNSEFIGDNNSDKYEYIEIEDDDEYEYVEVDEE